MRASAIVADYIAGKSVADIKQEHRVSGDTINRFLDAAGVARRVVAATPWSSEMENDLRRLWDEGVSVTQIGLRLGMPRNAIAGKARRLNLAYRKVHENFARPVVPRVVSVPDWTGCRWPMWGHKARPGDEGYGVVCGHEIERGSYCAEHRAMAYRTKSEDSDEAEAA